jgi:hypothetical protein
MGKRSRTGSGEQGAGERKRQKDVKDCKDQKDLYVLEVV